MITATEPVTGEQSVTADTVTPSGPISLRAYARHRGTSAPSVLRAIKRGRLNASLVIDAKGKTQIADVALADIEWAENTDLSRAPGYVKAREGKGPGRASGGAREVSSLAAASAREKDWRAKLAELEFQTKSGQLVNGDEVKARMVDLFTRCKTKLLGVPSKAKHAMPHLTHADVLTLDRLVREALEDLATMPVSTEGTAA